MRNTETSERSGDQPSPDSAVGLEVVPSLPSGGGAIQSISEGFRANPASGTAGLSLPLPFSAARGASPNLSLSYDSGSGNGPFGLGWSVGFGRITRRLSGGLPRYDDDWDVFSLAGAEDLVPVLDAAGARVEQTVNEDGVTWRVLRYRPRIESGFVRIEHWLPVGGGASHWRSWTRDNLVSIYGLSPEARLADPENADKVSDWALERQFDAQGNVTLYRYVPENDAALSAPEAARRGGAAVAGLYLKDVLYANRTPYSGELPATEDFCFRTVFDYGDHPEARPNVDPVGDWALREDAFSDYRRGFEVRTRRLCERIITFHIFPELSSDGAAVPVSGMELVYDTEGDGPCAMLTSVVPIAFAASGSAERMPATSFEYTPLVWGQAAEDVIHGGDVLPDTGRTRWSDLFGEGLPGLLSETGGSLRFARNLGEGRLAAATDLPLQPSLKGLGDVLTVEDPGRSGRKALVMRSDQLQGYHRIGQNGRTEPFRAFNTVPSGLGQTAFDADLDGDGLSDIVLVKAGALLRYPGLGVQGYGPPERLVVGEQSAPAMLARDRTGALMLADMSGDGLADVVRVEAGAVRYWPNLGHGRFGTAVEMLNVPQLDGAEGFDASRVRLSDIDGSGPSDLIYIGRSATAVWRNLSGNGWSEGHSLPLPPTAQMGQLSITDITGSGTAEVVWSEGARGRSRMRRFEITSGQKPWLMASIDNGLGGETRLGYTPSTTFYLRDAAAGRPWATRLHFPVHCLSSVEKIDHITGLRFQSSYSFHHGYYDPIDRSFRGFARVEQLDSEQIEAGAAPAYAAPPILTKTWFHTGAPEAGTALAEAEGYPLVGLPEFEAATVLPNAMTPKDRREALRALRGATLRAEVYAQGPNPDNDKPVSVSTSAWRIEMRQMRAADQHGSGQRPDGGWPVFQRLAQGSVSHVVDRTPEDARSSAEVVLRWDAFGTPTQTLALSYPRRMVDTSLPPEVQAAQARGSVLFSNVVLIDAEAREAATVPLSLTAPAALRHGPLPCEAESFEICGLALPSSIAAVALSAGMVAITRVKPVTLIDESQGRRLLSSTRNRYFDDTLQAVLPLGQVGRMAVAAESETLVFDNDILGEAYEGRVTPTDLEAARYRHSVGQDGQADARWWAVSGRTVFGDDPAARFYLPQGARDAFGVETAHFYDANQLLVTRAVDALQQEVVADIDYRLLSPRAVRDINHNWSVIESDTFGRVIHTANMGKVAGVDVPTGYEPCEGDTLAHPGSEHSYDVEAWQRDGTPVKSHGKVFETHYDPDASDAPERRTQETYSYSDGFGQVVLNKVKTSSGLALVPDGAGGVQEQDTGTAPRWIGNGRTVFNNKGQPLMAYEPYFAAGPEYDTDPALVEIGPLSMTFYDELGRSIGGLSPDGSWSKVQMSPWGSTAWDAGDTCGVVDPPNDLELGAYFAGLPTEMFAPGWVAQRTGGALGDDARVAADQSLDYADTPTRSYTDALGRNIYGVADNGTGGAHVTRTEMDVEGRTLAVIDARGNRVMSYVYGLGGGALQQVSMDAGQTWALSDIMGRAHLSWDAEGRKTRLIYDVVGRPLETRVTEAGNTRVIACALYGEAAPDAIEKNLLGTAWKAWDTAGLHQLDRADFKGNRLSAQQRLLADVTTEIDWPEDLLAREALLEADIYVALAEFDALGRTLRDVAPHQQGGVAIETWSGYALGGALATVDISRAGAPKTRFVEEITHDAKGQRQSIRYGNGVQTVYAYDPDSQRLSLLKTTRASDGRVLQDLRYTYDIVGNITAIRDHAQQVTYFSNQVVAPHLAYAYDATYRLIEAAGREHIDQAGLPDWASGWSGRSHREDGARMRLYSQHYAYDAVGNLTQLSHVAAGGNYTRVLGIEGATNQLEQMQVGDEVETFAYSDSGAMTRMGHLSMMTWDHAGRLRHVDKGPEGAVWFSYDASGRRVRKVMIRPDGRRQERLYLGGVEIYRERANDGSITKARETLEVSDDTGRIALMETLTHENGGTIAPAQTLIRYQCGNHLGSAMLELDDAAQIIGYEEYHPYGTTAYYEVASGREVPAKRYRYTGKERDEETGLSYHGARYYAPWLARWISADPIGIGDGVNLYSYVGNRPTRMNDPSGMAGDDPVSSGLPLVVENLNYGVDMRNAPPSFTAAYAKRPGGYKIRTKTTYNAFGAKRNAQYFFNEWAGMVGDGLSYKNADLISKGRTPFVDDALAAKFPWMKNFMGEKLRHHHYMHSVVATALPESTHHLGSKQLHPLNGALRDYGPKNPDTYRPAKPGPNKIEHSIIMSTDQDINDAATGRNGQGPSDDDWDAANAQKEKEKAKRAAKKAKATGGSALKRAGRRGMVGAIVTAGLMLYSAPSYAAAAEDSVTQGSTQPFLDQVHKQANGSAFYEMAQATKASWQQGDIRPVASETLRQGSSIVVGNIMAGIGTAGGAALMGGSGAVSGGTAASPTVVGAAPAAVAGGGIGIAAGGVLGGIGGGMLGGWLGYEGMDPIADLIAPNTWGGNN